MKKEKIDAVMLICLFSLANNMLLGLNEKKYHTKYHPELNY